jgi:phosphatidylglycerol lysyltransferase
MGTFDTDYIDQQAVFTAFVGDTPVAFATFHRGVTEYTLDLMRTGDDAPDGTMYALVTAGIAAARAAGCARLSLAAVPYEGEITDPRLSKLQTYARRTAPGAGLRQFKAAFAPRWEMLYVAASSPLALSVAGAEIIREILRPAA